MRLCLGFNISMARHRSFSHMSQIHRVEEKAQSSVTTCATSKPHPWLSAIPLMPPYPAVSGGCSMSHTLVLLLCQVHAAIFAPWSGKNSRIPACKWSFMKLEGRGGTVANRADVKTIIDGCGICTKGMIYCLHLWVTWESVRQSLLGTVPGTACPPPTAFSPRPQSQLS